MVASRITSTSASTRMLANLQQNLRSLTELQDRASSGKQLRMPSDGPAGVLAALEFRGQVRRNEQYQRNSTDARNWLQVTDATLTTAQDYLNRVRDLALQGANGATDGAGRTAIAQEIRQLRDGLLQLANTSIGSRQIFGGNSDNPNAFDTVTLAFNGDTGVITRAVAPGVIVAANVNGEAAFGSTADPAGNLFQVIDNLAADITAGDTATVRATRLAQLDAGRQRLSAVHAEVGARTKRIEDIDARNLEVNLGLASTLSEIEDIDYAETLVKITAQQTAYQVAMQATAKVLQPSLLDFLR
jgi:flagellar hook-associated protein 3 FlgL